MPCLQLLRLVRPPKQPPLSPSTVASATAPVEPGLDAAAVADMVMTLGGLAFDDISTQQRQQHETTIQDLPPLLLADIFSKYLCWEDIQGPVPQVCQAWNQVAAGVTPQQLSLEFDLVEDATPSSDESKSEGQTLLQALLSQPSKLLQRLTGQLRPQQPQQQQDPGDDADQQGGSTDSSAADQLQHQQFLQHLQNAPWERWVYQHGMQLQDFSMSITNLDSNCAAAQCQLKETLLRALAGSATPKAASTSSTSSTSTTATPRASDDSSSGSSSSDPDTPLSSACSEFSLSCSSDSNASAASTSSTSSSTSALQLKSLHLKVPLFECDVLLLAHGVCAKAPELKALSLVGYSNSSAVKTRGSSGSGLTNSKSSRHRLPINRPGNSRSGSWSGALAAQVAAATASGGRASPRGGYLIPVGHPSPPPAPPAWTPSPTSGRGGFITGSSLRQLMASVPQLQSLTFSCRQLYKLSWLAPASQLTHLSLRDCSLGGDLVKQLAALNLPQLRAVDLSGSKDLGGPRAEQHLQQLTRIVGGRLEQVDLSGWDLADTGGSSRELPHLAGLSRLSVLRMECCGLKGWAVQPGQLTSLSHLSLSGNPLDSRGVAAACALTQLRHLEVAQVACRAVALLPQQHPGTGPSCWSGMQPMPHLTSLNLAGNYWPDNSLPDRSPVLAFRAFKHNLCASIAAMPRLASINLTECKAPYSKLTQLLASLPPSVSEVVLDKAVDGIKTADVLALQALPQLRSLSACGCNVRDKHAGVLAGLTGLHSLVVRDNALGPEGLAELVEGCRQLALLDVSGNEKLKCVQACSNGSRQHLVVLRDREAIWCAVGC